MAFIYFCHNFTGCLLYRNSWIQIQQQICSAVGDSCFRSNAFLWCFHRYLTPWHLQGLCINSNQRDYGLTKYLLVWQPDCQMVNFHPISGLCPVFCHHDCRNQTIPFWLPLRGISNYWRILFGILCNAVWYIHVGEIYCRVRSVCLDGDTIFRRTPLFPDYIYVKELLKR